MSKVKARKIIVQKLVNKPNTNSRLLSTFTNDRFKQSKLLDTGFRAHGQPVYSLQISGSYTREQIYEHMDLKSKNLQRKDPLTQFQIVLKLRMTNQAGNQVIEYRAGKFTNAGQHPDIWSPIINSPGIDSDSENEGEMPEILGFNVNMIKQIPI